jgi:UDP-N-acetylglucosamine pyrophosphorylase
LAAHEFSTALEKDFREKNIDRNLTMTILDRFNRGDFDRYTPISVDSIPEVDGKKIIDVTGKISFSLPERTVRERLDPYLPAEEYSGIGRRENGFVVYDKGALWQLGLLLVPRIAYGILNGGSATSYIDLTKNISFSKDLYSLTEKTFLFAAEISEGKPKGITPAFFNPDGSPGPSFLELKVRSLLLLAREYTKLYGKTGLDSLELGLLPVFQMTSLATDRAVEKALEEYHKSPLLSGLYSKEHTHILSPLTAVQPLIAAYTHSSEGRPRRLFTRAWGKKDSLLPLPGGHGQNFAVLKDIYRNLYRSGKRFAYLGNIDNLGNTIDPLGPALLALSGKEGAFEFSYKTPVDVKGGILVQDSSGRLNAVDMGPAVPREEVLRAEQKGSKILFNCATGIFNLEYLNRNIDRIIEKLPIRFSDQNKDAGNYSQAEQITWEVLGLLEDPLILAVRKYDRFLASKLLLENLMTSGIGLNSPDYPEQFRSVAEKLHQGLTRLLSGPYGLRLVENRWIPREELEQ